MLDTDNIRKAPLLVHLVFHPESASARELAKHIHAALNVDSVVQGLRIPTIFCKENSEYLPPADQQLDLAEQSFVIPLADTDMNLAEEWCNFIAELWEACDGTKHRCVPVQLTEDAWPLSPERLGTVNFVPAFAEPEATRVAFIVRRIIIELCRYIHGDDAGGKSPEAPTKLFISHTKMDINQKPRVVQQLKDHLKIDQPIDAWFDSGDIPAGSAFTQKIAEGVEDSSLLCVLTDNYASREWCRKEILLAKEKQRPVVVINALHHTEMRSFPYLGNLPVMRWDNDPQAAIDLILKETLRNLHTYRLLHQWQQPDDMVFTLPPELATIVGLPATATVLYPEPPLGKEEVDMLRKTGVTVTTPLERLTSSKVLKAKAVALSMSESTDCHLYGVDKLHLDSAMLELSRYLLIQGATLVYGGHLGSQGYTEKLTELVRAHNQLADIDPVERIVNYVGWPIPLSKTQRADYKYKAKLKPVARPLDIDESLHTDFSEQPDFFSADQSAIHRYAWARGMNAMRKLETAETVARIVLGGSFGPTIKTAVDGSQTERWYASRIPGVLEEIIMSVESGQPVFLLGGFGGVAAMVVDILEGKDRPEMSWDYQRKAPHADAMRALYEERGDNWQDYDEMIALFRHKGMSGINSLLTEEEHKLLFHTRDPLQMASLIIKGLGNL
jgi:hypothetical protein